MLEKYLIACVIGLVVAFEVVESEELLPFALLLRAIRGISSRQQSMTRISFPRRPARPRFPKPHIVRTDTDPVAAVTDPADMLNILGAQCTTRNPNALAHMFQDMFVSSSEVETLVTEAKNGLRNSNSGNSKSNSGIETERMSRKIGRVNSGNSGGSGSDCCDTEMRITAPFTVLEGGRRMQVVHMNSSYQFVHEGVCVNPRAKCQGYGECVQIYKYSYMLLYDPNLRNVFPPVRFGRVQIRSHCECMNIGA